MSATPIDPEIAAMLAATPPHPPYAELGAEGARETFRRAVADGRGPEWAPEPVHRVEDMAVPGPEGPIPVRLYQPVPHEPLPVVVYFHGGGWTIGDRDTHDAQARMLCNGAEAVVLSVDYRLAPEHPFPAAYDDAVTATTWAVEHAAEIGGDLARVAVAGDSSGGNLAAAVCLWARDHDGPPIAAQCLIYPVTDLHGDIGSWVEFSGNANLDADDMDWFNANYVPDPALRDDPRASPLRAADLSGLPPAIVATADHDILRDQGEAYAERLRAAGVTVFARRYDGMVHSFFRHSDVSPAAKAANDDICQRLRALLHHDQGEPAWP